MKRRNFLKSIATVCGAAVVRPAELLEKRRHPGIDKIPEHMIGVGGRAKHIVMGVTDAQLRELVQITLKDLPLELKYPDLFGSASYSLCRNPKGEYYPGEGLSD